MKSTLNLDKLSEMVKKKRGSKGLREVAKEIGNVSASTLSRIEQGNLPDVETYIKLCDWLQVSTDFFTSTLKEDLSSQKIITAHLRANKSLPQDTANALIKMIELAFETYEDTK